MQELLQETSRLLKPVGIEPPNEDKVHYQTAPEVLAHQTVTLKQGAYSDNGALVIRTGEFTGRSPKDRFIVRDALTEKTVDWNEINLPFQAADYRQLRKKMIDHLSGRGLWIRDGRVCADRRYQLNIRLISEKPWASLFCYNMFLRPEDTELSDFQPDWTVLHAPEFYADPGRDKTRQGNFVLINFKAQEILIGGTAYTGEIKKGIFSVLNYLLPIKETVLSMHCSANAGADGDTALFFGLSGTGKTTLSNDPDRYLIGDDEHGWSRDNIFNFEGGCYAKCIDLSEEKEPQIYHAIRPGALVENVRFYKNTERIDYTDCSITQNTRVSYPLFHLENHKQGSVGKPPKHIFFLTCDAYGILPPVSKLTPAQAMYQFLCGYTAKVAGTETGVNEPQATFSTCFAAPFLPLHPTIYANLLGDKLKGGKVICWLINTGWTGGKYGKGNRIALRHTRSIVRAVLNNELTNTAYHIDPVFGLAVPDHCPDVPERILYPRATWEDKAAYDTQARELAGLFRLHFRQFAEMVEQEVCSAGPQI